MKYVRDGQQVVPTCPECGCRLQQWDGDHPGWYHFFNDNLYEAIGRDARWHKCKFVFSRFVDGVPYNAVMESHHGITSTSRVSSWEVAR